MRGYLPFVVIGLTTGGVYALASLGLVLTYRTSGVFNFAHGAVGMIATFIFYSLRVDAGVPTWLAAALAILVVAPAIGVVIDRVLLRRLRGAAASSYVVVSLGLLVGLQYLAIVIYGPATRSVEPIFSRGTFRLPGVNVGYDQAIIVAISLASALLLAAFFRATRLGIQTRAVVRMNVYDLDVIKRIAFEAQSLDVDLTGGVRIADVDQAYKARITNGAGTTTSNTSPHPGRPCHCSW